jgi:hypothetical protein
MWWFILILVGLFVLNRLLVAQGSARTGGGGGNPWKVYGTMGCGWTRRQIDELKKKGEAYTFLDCSKGECEGQNVTGMPLNILPDGTKKVGFTEVN